MKVFDYGTRRAALGAAAAALLALVSACATQSPARPAAEASADVLRAEIKEKTYDLELDRVTTAVRTYLQESGGRILSTPSPDDLVLDAELRDLRYEVSFELVVEGVTVRVQTSPLETEELYRQFFAGVDARL